MEDYDSSQNALNENSTDYIVLSGNSENPFGYTEEDSVNNGDDNDQDRNVRYSMYESEAVTPFLRSPIIFFQERFSAGSIKGSISTLVVAIVGAGTLSVPLAFQQAGLILGVILFILGACSTFFFLRLLILSSELSGVKSYSGIARKLYGPCTEAFTHCCLLLNLYGTSISYVVASGSMLSPVVLLLFGRQNDQHIPYYLSSKCIMIVVTLLIIIPASLYRTMGALRYSSLIAVIGSIYLAVVVMVQGRLVVIYFRHL